MKAAYYCRIFITNLQRPYPFHNANKVRVELKQINEAEYWKLYFRFSNFKIYGVENETSTSNTTLDTTSTVSSPQVLQILFFHPNTDIICSSYFSYFF